MQTKNAFKAFAIALSIFTIGVLVATPTFAQTVTPTTTLRDRIGENRCERVTKRVDARITRFEENKQRHVDRYNKIKTRVTELITKLDAAGYDTSKVKEDMVELDAKIKVFSDNYVEFIDLLKQTKTYACGGSEGEFKSTIEKAQVQLKKTRASAKDVITFVREELRPDIKDLRNQKKDQ